MHTFVFKILNQVHDLARFFVYVLHTLPGSCSGFFPDFFTCPPPVVSTFAQVHRPEHAEGMCLGRVGPVQLCVTPKGGTLKSEMPRRLVRVPGRENNLNR